MNKLVCKCGNIIIAQTGDQSNKGSIIKGYDEEEFFDIVSGNIGILLNRKPGGIDRIDWIIEEFGEDYPVDSSMDKVIRDYITKIGSMYFKRIYDCKKCGALWLQENESPTKFRYYQPE
jgi:hypothetical protein